MSVRILSGHVLDKLAELEAESVQCCITSPPYMGLRSYNTEPQTWPDDWVGELGQEPAVDLYVAHLVAVFAAVRRVLRRDGLLFVNLGDSYAGGKTSRDDQDINRRNLWDGSTPEQRAARKLKDNPPGKQRPVPAGMKPKDLMLVPDRFRLAMQQPYVKPGAIERDVDKAWMAAMLDGEGCISIRQHNGKSSNGNPCQPSFIPFLCIGNNDRELLDRCVEITGFSNVYLKDRPSTDDRGINSRRDYYGWRLDGDKSVDVIRDSYPFLIAKRKQALLQYNLWLSNKRGKELRGNGPLPKTEQDKRALLYDLIKRCNQREHVDIPSWCVEPTPEIEPGWYVRSKMPWVKRNCMPESAKDRPVSAVEDVMLFTKSARCFWDHVAVLRSQSGTSLARYAFGFNKTGKGLDLPGGASYVKGDNTGTERIEANTGGRNLRNGDLFFDSLGLILDEAGDPLALDVNPAGFPGAHFATFPPKLVRPLILAGTSEKGCCVSCGSPWVRVLTAASGGTIGRSWHDHKNDDVIGQRAENAAKGGNGYQPKQTTGWSPSCSCPDPGPPVPCTVLDIFAGSGTTGLVADQLGRDAVLIDLQPDYITMGADRITGDAPLFASVKVTP